MALTELSFPAHEHWRNAVKAELVSVFGQPNSALSAAQILAQVRNIHFYVKMLLYCNYLLRLAPPSPMTGQLNREVQAVKYKRNRL
jgi:hypothetical protein